jgi:hypothetical protein
MNGEEEASDNGHSSTIRGSAPHLELFTLEPSMKEVNTITCLLITLLVLVSVRVIDDLVCECASRWRRVASKWQFLSVELMMNIHVGKMLLLD